MRAAFVKYSLFVTLLNPIVAHAADGDWKVAKASQSVKYALDKNDWHTVRVGDIVPNGAWVSTGPRGRVQLTRGVESVSFQPDTLASIVTTGTADSQTEVIQKTGTLDLEMEHRDHPHAKVETPFLAAVVKGTIFRVSVTTKKASVSVTRGLVQVRSFASGQQSNIGPTQSASVSAVAGMTVKGIDVTPQIVSVPSTVSPVQATSPSTTSTAPSSTGGLDAKSSVGSNAGSGSAGSRGGDGGSSGRGSSSTANPTTSTSNNGGDTPGASANGDDNSDASNSGANGKNKANGNSKGAKGAKNAQDADDNSNSNSNSADKNDKGDKTDSGKGKDDGNKGNNGHAYGHDKGKGKDKGK